MIICRWCRKEIKPHTQSYVRTETPVGNGFKITSEYHAKVCYEAFRALVELHNSGNSVTGGGAR